MNTKAITSNPQIENTGSKDISKRSFSALVWNYAGTAVSMASQFLVGIVLARLLGPEAFGIFAVGVLMVSIGSLVMDFGLSVALIQGRNITERDVSFVFTVHVLLGTLLSLICYLSASSIAALFRYSNGTSIIKAMSLLFFIQAFGQSAGALLRRSLNFKAYQGINIVSYLVGYVLIGIPCALYGLGPWSLVAAQMIQSFIFSLVSVLHSKLRLRLVFKPTTHSLCTFGGKVLLINLSNWGLSNLDSFSVGRFLGLSDLGIYNRAMVLIATPINTVTGALQGVILAACSRLETDANQIKKAYLSASTVISLICLPLCLTAASVSGTIITAIYGEKWTAAIPVFQPLALSFAISALLSVTGPILTAQNRLLIELRAEFIALLVMSPIVYIAAQYSTTMIAWAVLLINIFRFGLLLFALSISLNTSFLKLIKPIKWPLIYALITSGLTLMIDHYLQGSHLFVILISDIATAIMSMILILRVFGTKIMKGPHGDYLMANIPLHPLLRRWIGI